MVFSFDIPPAVYVLAAVAFVAALWLLLGYRRRVASVVSACIPSVPSSEIADSGWPAASVIVYSSGDAGRLEQLLPQVLKQDYPGPFEVVVVNDGSSADCADVVKRLRIFYPNLYATFTPEDTRNLSRRKLAVTLGIKAARQRVILLTDTDVTIPSHQWMRSMLGPFACQGIEVVIGSAAPGPDCGLDDFSRFDMCAGDVTYLSAALAGHPYRGTHHNLAYTRDIFFAHKGFSSSLNLHEGDDDIFINEIATGANTVVALDAGARLLLSAHHPRRVHSLGKRQRLFTARFLPVAPRLLMGAGSLAMWVMTLSAVAAAVVGLPNLVPASAMAVLLLGVWLPLMVVWRRAVARLSRGRIFWRLPAMLLWRPFANLACRLEGRRHAGENYTWKKG